MTWIKSVSIREADQDLLMALRNLKKSLPKEYGSPVPSLAGNEDSIIDSHTLIPNALHHAFSLNGALMSDDLPLERRQEEMIATVVSKTNDCFY